eukprot:3314230-Amphidinium_carterae.1
MAGMEVLFPVVPPRPFRHLLLRSCCSPCSQHKNSRDYVYSAAGECSGNLAASTCLNLVWFQPLTAYKTTQSTRTSRSSTSEITFTSSCTSGG